MRKILIRSKSESDWFRDKENLDIINDHLKKFKKNQIIKLNNEKNDISDKNNTSNIHRNANQNITNIFPCKSKTEKNKQRISLFEGYIKKFLFCKQTILIKIFFLFFLF